MNIELTKISSKGQVVIPQSIRRRIGLSEGETLSVSMIDGLIVMKKVRDPIEVDDLQTLIEIKEAWKEIEEGKCNKMDSVDFLKEVSKW